MSPVKKYNYVLWKQWFCVWSIVTYWNRRAKSARKRSDAIFQIVKDKLSSLSKEDEKAYPDSYIVRNKLKRKGGGARIVGIKLVKQNVGGGGKLHVS